VLQLARHRVGSEVEEVKFKMADDRIFAYIESRSIRRIKRYEPVGWLERGANTFEKCAQASAIVGIG
jgi:hypothetical protein